MNLTGIIAISGKPGLYKVIAQGKNNIIVESLETNKRLPAYASDRISALEDISIYAYDEDKPLKEIFQAIYEKESGKEAISHKEDAAKLREYLLEILPNYDQERVYNSDIKKLFQWYNLLLASGNLIMEEEAPAQVEEEVTSEEKPAKKTTKKASEAKTEEKAAKEPAAKKAPAKKAPAKKATDKPVAKAGAKTSTAKKAATPKAGAARGK